MKAFVIGDKNNAMSAGLMDKCIKSSNIPIEIFQQTSPETLKEHKRPFGVMAWNYPMNEAFGMDHETKIVLRPYKTNNSDKAFACTISHARLWQKCIELNEEIMILEHDALFTRKFEPFDWDGGVLGLNDPRGATWKSLEYHKKVSATKGVKDIPWIVNKSETLQGLAGNSAYIIKPDFAKKVLDKLKDKGGWPNDTLMCRQYFPNEIKVVYPYYTIVQKHPSTTVL